MSSIDEKELERFFDEVLTPAANALAARGAPLLPRPSEATAYSGPPDEPALLELSPEAFAEELAAHWRRQGMDELAALAPELGRFAVGLRPTVETTEDLSPFVYVMF